MSVNRISTRYAKSLVDLALEQNKLERINDDVQLFLKAADNRDLQMMLRSPIINTDKKLSVLKALFADKMDELTIAFFAIVTTKGRESLLVDIAKAAQEQYRKIKKISMVQLTSAAQLSNDMIDRIREKIKSSGMTEENIELDTKIDPKLIGGFVLQFDDQRYDASIAHQLDRLRKEFS